MSAQSIVILIGLLVAEALFVSAVSVGTSFSMASRFAGEKSITFLDKLQYFVAILFTVLSIACEATIIMNLTSEKLTLMLILYVVIGGLYGNASAIIKDFYILNTSKFNKRFDFTTLGLLCATAITVIIFIVI